MSLYSSQIQIHVRKLVSATISSLPEARQDSNYRARIPESLGNTRINCGEEAKKSTGSASKQSEKTKKEPQRVGKGATEIIAPTSEVGRGRFEQ